jgi:hypothetical protein
MCAVCNTGTCERSVREGKLCENSVCAADGGARESARSELCGQWQVAKTAGVIETGAKKTSARGTRVRWLRV